MIEVGLGDGRFWRRMCASMTVLSLEVSLGVRTVHDKRPNGVAARTRAKRDAHRGAGHACAPNPTYSSVLGRPRGARAAEAARRKPAPTRAKRYARRWSGDMCAPNHTITCRFCLGTVYATCACNIGNHCTRATGNFKACTQVRIIEIN